MNVRFVIPCVAAVFLSCASADSAAPALRAVVDQSEGDAGSACPAWLKLEGEIGDPSDFLAALHACEGHAVVVEINSPGGSIFGALEIQKAFERFDHPVLCVVDGVAASAAFLILQSCDLRAMTPRSLLMAHEAALTARGQISTVVNATALLRVINRALALECSARLKMSVADYEARVVNGQEWWMGLEDGLAFHAIDFKLADINAARELAKGR